MHSSDPNLDCNLGSTHLRRWVMYPGLQSGLAHLHEPLCKRGFRDMRDSGYSTVLKVKCLNPVDSVAKPVSGHHSNLTCWREYGLGMRRASILTLSGNEARMRLVHTNTYTKRWWWCHLAQCNVESRRVGEGKGNIATVLLCCLGRHCPGGPFPFFFFFFFFFEANCTPCKWEEDCDLNVGGQTSLFCLFTNY